MGKPAFEVETGLFLFDVTADEEFFFGTGRGNVEQAAVFGIFEIGFMAGGNLPGGGMEIISAQVEESSLFHVPGYKCSAGVRLVRSVGDDSEGKFESLGFVDSHQLDGAAG